MEISLKMADSSKNLLFHSKNPILECVLHRKALRKQKSGDTLASSQERKVTVVSVINREWPLAFRLANAAVDTHALAMKEVASM